MRHTHSEKGRSLFLPYSHSPSQKLEHGCACHPRLTIHTLGPGGKTKEKKPRFLNDSMEQSPTDVEYHFRLRHESEVYLCILEGTELSLNLFAMEM